MKSIFKISSIIIYLLLPMVVNAECTDKHTSAECSQNNYYEGTCIWDDNDGCTERCPTNNDGTCINYDGCYDTGYLGCSPCGPNTYNNTSGATSCTSCSSFSYSNPGQIFDTAYANTYGLSTCPWMCDNGYYRGGANDDTCIQCTGNLTCSGTGLEYSNTYNPTGISCSSNYRLVPDDTTHTYSCQSCTDSHATLNGNNCVCNVGYYGTPNGVNTQCTACPAGTTTDTAGATAKSACHMTQNTKFCDANGENCMKLLPAGITINQ